MGKSGSPVFEAEAGNGEGSDLTGTIAGVGTAVSSSKAGGGTSAATVGADVSAGRVLSVPGEGVGLGEALASSVPSSKGGGGALTFSEGVGAGASFEELVGSGLFSAVAAEGDSPGAGTAALSLSGLISFMSSGLPCHFSS